MRRRILVIVASTFVLAGALIGGPKTSASVPRAHPRLLQPGSLAAATGFEVPVPLKRPHWRPPSSEGIKTAVHTAPAVPYIKASCLHGLVHDLIVADFPASQLVEALDTASHESSCYPYAKNPDSTASGVFQFLDTTWAYWSGKCGYKGANVFGARANVAVAACVVAAEGWGPWST